MFIVKYKAFFIGLSLALVIASCVTVGVFGIKRGVDFTGGTVVELAYATSTPELFPVAAVVEKDIKVFQTGEHSYKFIGTQSYEDMMGTIMSAHPYAHNVISVNNVGPTLGKEMTKKAIIAIVVVVLAILAFIAFSFRKVSKPISSWKYGVIAMVTMVHDIIIPVGAYALLSHYHGAEVDTLFVVALLTVMAVTISDKIVVFDRIRENLRLSGTKKSFDEIVGMSLSQTFARSVNTSLTTVLSLVALYFFGPTTTQFFALTLLVGLVVGTYSSIFVASPLLTMWNGKNGK